MGRVTPPPRFALTLPGLTGSFPPMSEDLKTRLRNDRIVVRKARNRLGTMVLTTLLSEQRRLQAKTGPAGRRGSVASAPPDGDATPHIPQVQKRCPSREADPQSGE